MHVSSTQVPVVTMGKHTAINAEGEIDTFLAGCVTFTMNLIFILVIFVVLLVVMTETESQWSHNNKVILHNTSIVL